MVDTATCPAIRKEAELKAVNGLSSTSLIFKLTTFPCFLLDGGKWIARLK